jgi:sugar transferase EpsL
MLKRILDIVTSALALAVLAVPMLLIALAVRISSAGPAIFRQRRAGWRGKWFSMLKFRTMRADVDPYGASPHSQDDQRMTPLGRFLREWSLDELPQLLNVLAGQMSMVGPRPLYERQAELWNDRQRRRLQVRPGMTGYAQAFGRAALTHEEKLEMDVYYVEHRGFLLDLKIILRTVGNLLSGRGRIYEDRYSAAKERETD